MLRPNKRYGRFLKTAVPSFIEPAPQPPVANKRLLPKPAGRSLTSTTPSTPSGGVPGFQSTVRTGKPQPLVANTSAYSVNANTAKARRDRADIVSGSYRARTKPVATAATGALEGFAVDGPKNLAKGVGHIAKYAPREVSRSVINPEYGYKNYVKPAARWGADTLRRYGAAAHQTARVATLQDSPSSKRSQRIFRRANERLPIASSVQRAIDSAGKGDWRGAGSATFNAGVEAAGARGVGSRLVKSKVRNAAATKSEQIVPGKNPSTLTAAERKVRLAKLRKVHGTRSGHTTPVDARPGAGGAWRRGLRRTYGTPEGTALRNEAKKRGVLKPQVEADRLEDAARRVTKKDGVPYKNYDDLRGLGGNAAEAGRDPLLPKPFYRKIDEAFYPRSIRKALKRRRAKSELFGTSSGSFSDLRKKPIHGPPDPASYIRSGHNMPGVEARASVSPDAPKGLRAAIAGHEGIAEQVSVRGRGRRTAQGNFYSHDSPSVLLRESQQMPFLPSGAVSAMKSLRRRSGELENMDASGVRFGAVPKVTGKAVRKLEKAAPANVRGEYRRKLTPTEQSARDSFEKFVPDMNRVSWMEDDVANLARKYKDSTIPSGVVRRATKRIHREGRAIHKRLKKHRDLTEKEGR